MSEQKQRQGQEEQVEKIRPRGRITRGFSDLPKDELREEQESESSEESQEEDNSPPKIKKIHHMTLKAIERRNKLAQKKQKQGSQKDSQSKKQKAERPISRRRGRPRGSKKVEKQDRQDYQVNMEEDSVQQEEDDEEIMRQKRELNLRKRDRAKKLVQAESEEKQKEKEKEKDKESNIMKEIEISLKLDPQLIVIKKEEPAAPSVPRKRGRKKKVQTDVEIPIMKQMMQPPQAPLKVYTVPKAQTYHNYHKYYNKLIEETKQGDKPEIPLIFDRFTDPQSYKRLLSDLNIYDQ